MNREFFRAGLQEYGTLEAMFEHFKQTPSDMFEHVETLRALASECETVTEMGFRSGVSAVAMLSGRPKRMVSYDISDNWCGVAYQDIVADLAIGARLDWKFVLGDVLRLDIEETEMLFIDTLHTKNQLAAELRRHSSKAKKYMVFHDVVTFGRSGEDGSPGGLMDAIEEFLYPASSSFDSLISLNATKRVVNPDWKIREIYHNCNGLAVLERIK